MRNKTLLVGTIVLTAALAAGCAKPPQEHVDAAKAALAAAETAGAKNYAADKLRAAQDAMNAVQNELDAQQAKVALFRSYKQTEELVTQATDKANEAAAAAAAGKQKAHDDAASAIEAANASLASADSAMTALEGCRRKPKGFAADMTTMKGTLDGLKGEIATAQSSMASEDYLGATSQAETVKTQADTLVADLEAAKKKMGC
jgi:hypothetical protein